MNDRRILFAVACLGMLAFGIVLTTLGAVLPSIMTRFGIDKAEAGTLFLLLSFGILVGSLVFGPIVDRYGYKRLLLLATAMIAAGLEGIAIAPSMSTLRVAIALIGIGGGVVNGGTNALVADVSAEGRSSGLALLGVFFGLGAMGVPFALGTLLDRFSYGIIIAFAGATVLIPLIVTAAARFPAPKQEQGFPLGAAGRLLKDPVLLLMGLLLFLESGMEITVGGWTSTYFKEELGLTEQRALVMLSLYWLGLMLSRLALSRILERTAPSRVLLGCIGVALAGSLLLLGSTGVAAAAAGVFLIGTGFAAVFPVVLGFAADRYAALSGTAFSIVIVMALTGGMLMPYTTGIIGGTYGMRGSFIVVPAAIVVQAALLLIVSRRLAVRTEVGVVVAD